MTKTGSGIGLSKCVMPSSIPLTNYLELFAVHINLYGALNCLSSSCKEGSDVTNVQKL